MAYYTCSVCGEKVEGDAVRFIDHTQKHIIDHIKQRYPQWVKEDGLCPRCLDYLRQQLRGGDR